MMLERGVCRCQGDAHVTFDYVTAAAACREIQRLRVITFHSAFRRRASHGNDALLLLICMGMPVIIAPCRGAMWSTTGFHRE